MVKSINENAHSKGKTLVVTIPAYNEEKTIQTVIESIPKKMDGFSRIKILVIDDGSSDDTAVLALKAGAVVFSNHTNRGLAYSFSRALELALDAGADVIVNTDGDNQYDQSQIPSLVEPILKGKADIVLGSRFMGEIEEMSFSKRWGNKLATRAVSIVSGIKISDGQTGFRAFTRDAALRLNIFSNFTYTQETILDAADKGLRIVEIPCTFRKRRDENRLFSSVWNYAARAASTLILGDLKYHPITSFGSAGIFFIFLGLVMGWPVFENYFSSGIIGPAYIMRAVATGVFIIIGIEIAALGLIAALVKQNRLILEKQLYESKKWRYDKKN